MAISTSSLRFVSWRRHAAQKRGGFNPQNRKSHDFCRDFDKRSEQGLDKTVPQNPSPERLVIKKINHTDAYLLCTRAARICGDTAHFQVGMTKCRKYPLWTGANTQACLGCLCIHNAGN
ncbi:hypothetical protein G6L63_12105 [Agrobacterium vitis]|uniref:hypothetical protein n=1 Tax=Agrobacterium vitis TaxID=373 RepID=UPI0011C07537|nr:hypothetical protein [Agrobacterium vitis]MCF1479298.1 hypothetical protein [Agrobacterium vitis]MUZ97613.1 hypothetical protein [Agrobacterium vitis]MVA30408.1 hypothetical protein [Agrobacterium vitis]NOJ33583.1 hypothetical protein [Agrobacterium vitis]NSZ48655.1 hypothetical protein [Agrobacterium vitis]